MTPNFLGRVQTRIFLSIFIGLPVALYFDALNFLFVMIILGIGWDSVFNFFQNKRHDRDWPPIFILMQGLIEWLIPWGIVVLIFPLMAVNLTLMYWVFWALSFIAQLGVLNIFFPKRRFRSGRIL